MPSLAASSLTGNVLTFIARPKDSQNLQHWDTPQNSAILSGASLHRWQCLRVTGHLRGGV